VRQCRQLLHGGGIPDAKAVAAATGRPLAVGAERQAIDAAPVPAAVVAEDLDHGVGLPGQPLAVGQLIAFQGVQRRGQRPELFAGAECLRRAGV